MSGYNNWVEIHKVNKKIVGCSLDFSDFVELDREASIDRHIKLLLMQYDNFYIAMSGGIDSEFTAKCFWERGIKFTPLLLDFISNRIELWYAYKWCRDHGLVPEVVNLGKEDLVRIFSSVAVNYNYHYINGVKIILKDYVKAKNGTLIFTNYDPFKKLYFAEDTLNLNGSQHLEFNTYDFLLYQLPEVEQYDKVVNSFLYYTSSLAYDTVKNLDYNKPMQLGLAEYYGVAPRPKIPPYLQLWLFLSQLNMDKKITSRTSISLGTRDNFLRHAEEKKILRCGVRG